MTSILNAYAGIGGNRKEWPDHVKVTAIERDENIAALYQQLYPQDRVIVADAHQYILENHQEFDLIWSSPPCQSHSRMIRSGRNRKPRYPDMRLYEEIIYLQHNHSGGWVVENVKPYYQPLLEPRYIGRHAFWSSFDVGHAAEPVKNFDFINATNLAAKAKLMDWLGIHFDQNIYYEGNHCPAQILRNAVHPEIGLHVLNQWLGLTEPNLNGELFALTGE